MSFTEFVDWGFLATYAGAVAATGLITHMLKDAIKVPTRLLAYVVALVVLLAALFFVGELTISSAVLSLFNAAIVAFATSGAIDAKRQIVG